MIVKHGEALFDQIIFVGKPDSNLNNFLITATSMKKQKLIEIFGQEYFESDLIGDFEISFRSCIEGEEEVKSQCEVCKRGFYSLHLKSKICEKCVDNVDCLGGNKMKVAEGFWR